MYQPTQRPSAHGKRPSPRLGLDIGGVLVDRAFHDSDTSFFGNRPLETPAVPGAIADLAPLVTEVFEHRVVLISKAGTRIAMRTREWLEHIGFFALTGVARHDVHFVTRRVDKGPLCAELGVTHFVDDRSEVLDALTTVPHRYLFTGGLGSVLPDTPGPGVTTAASWPELAALLRRSAGS